MNNKLKKVSGGANRRMPSIDFGTTLFGDSYSPDSFKVTSNVKNKGSVKNTSCINGNCSSNKTKTKTSYTTTNVYDGSDFNIVNLY